MQKKHFSIYSLAIIILISCKKNKEIIIKNKESYYKEIIDSCLKNKINNFTINKLSNQNLKKLNFDYFELIDSLQTFNCQVLPYHFKDFEKVAFFVKNSKSILEGRQTIVYDYANFPRDLIKDTFYQNADIEIKKLNQRMYLIREGFD